MRRATIDDMLLYFEWVNDPDVRQNSFNQTPITLEEHKQWFQKKLSSPSSYLFVLECQGQPAGQIRFDEVEEGVFEIGFSIDMKYRGFGLGKHILSQSIQELKKNIIFPCTIYGLVKSDNVASTKAFLKAGFLLDNVQNHSSGVDRFSIHF